jgi:hypothetical protein
MAPRRHPQRGLGIDVGAQARNVFNEYLTFLRADGEADDPDRARAFLARHTAARAAITHIDALLKLDGGDPPDTQDQQNAMVAQARRALAGDRPENLSDEPEAED